MDLPVAHYEVVFALDGGLVGAPFRWSWVKIGADGLVLVYGRVHATMRAAIDDAANHRREHGGGAIRVNIKETARENAQDVTYLA